MTNAQKAYHQSKKDAWPILKAKLQGKKGADSAKDRSFEYAYTQKCKEVKELEKKIKGMEKRLDARNVKLIRQYWQ